MRHQTGRLSVSDLPMFPKKQKNDQPIRKLPWAPCFSNYGHLLSLSLSLLSVRWAGTDQGAELRSERFQYVKIRTTTTETLFTVSLDVSSFVICIQRYRVYSSLSARLQAHLFHCQKLGMFLLGRRGQDTSNGT